MGWFQVANGADPEGDPCSEPWKKGRWRVGGKRPAQGNIVGTEVGQGGRRSSLELGKRWEVEGTAYAG